MAKNKKMVATQNTEIEKSDEVLEVKKPAKLSMEEKQKAKLSEKQAKQKKASKQKNDKPKRNYAKETVSELKKVSWPSFKKACKQTGTVLAVVAVFMLVVLGIDSLLSWIISLIVNI